MRSQKKVPTMDVFCLHLGTWQRRQRLPFFSIAPIPSYFVYDGFEKNLDAALVFEPLLEFDGQCLMIDHAKQLVASALVGPLRTSDKKPFFSATDWQTHVPMQAKQ